MCDYTNMIKKFTKIHIYAAILRNYFTQKQLKCIKINVNSIEIPTANLEL